MSWRRREYEKELGKVGVERWKWKRAWIEGIGRKRQGRKERTTEGELKKLTLK